MRTFQYSVDLWVRRALGDDVAVDKEERAFRFTEEAIELSQAAGVTKEGVLALVDYVFDRPVGEFDQEVGGVMTTIAALCNAHEKDMGTLAVNELDSIWKRMEAIREKHKTKIRGSSLPGNGTS